MKSICFCETNNSVNEKCSNCNKLKLSKEQELCGELKERNQSMIKKKEMLKKQLEKSGRHCVALSSIIGMGECILDDQNSIEGKPRNDLDIKILQKYLKEKDNDLLRYEQLIQKIGNAVKKANKMQEELRKIKSIEELTAIEIEMSLLDTEITDEEEKILEKKTEDDSRLMELNLGIIQKIKKLNKDAKIDEILTALNSDCDKKEKIVTIGLIGDSGTGKSSFINRARFLPDINRDDLTSSSTRYNENSPAVVVATDEGTAIDDRILHFSSPENKLVKYLDFPGYGQIELDDYYKLCKKENCDMFLLLFQRSFSLNDLKLIKYIHKELKKPIFIAKTNIDKMFNDKAFLRTCNDNKNKTLEKIRETTEKQKNELKEHISKGEIFGSSYDQVKIYLVSCNQEQILGPFDLNTLVKDMHNSIENRITKDFIVQNTCLLGKELIHEKKLSLQRRIKTLALVAGATDIVPIAGGVANIAILIGEAVHYQKCFGLTEEYLKRIAIILKIDYKQIEKIGSIIGIVGEKAKYANMRNFVTIILAGLQIGISSTLNVALGATSIALGILTFGISFAVTTAISAPLSYILTKKALNKILETMEKDSLKLVDLLLEEKKKLEEVNSETYP